MEEIKLDVLVRDEIGSRKIKSVRRHDLVPGVIYGGKKPPTTVKIDRRMFERIRRQHHGEVVFHVNVYESDKKLKDYSAIVKEEQRHPVTDKILHIDFLRISLKEKMEFKVPIEVKGEPIGVKRDNGSLDHVLWELDVFCLPTEIPERLVVEVSKMEIGDSVHVKDIVLPPNVITHHDQEALVLSVVPPQKEEVEEEPQEGDGEPEVIGEKKEGEAPAEEDKKEEPKGEKKGEKKEEKKEEKKGE